MSARAQGDGARVCFEKRAVLPAQLPVGALGRGEGPKPELSPASWPAVLGFFWDSLCCLLNGCGWPGLKGLEYGAAGNRWWRRLEKRKREEGGVRGKRTEGGLGSLPSPFLSPILCRSILVTGLIHSSITSDRSQSQRFLPSQA